MCTERPTQPKVYLSAATSSTRRDNPKANGPNGGRKVCLQVPAPKVKPVFDVVAEYHGLELFHISDAVPYREYFFLIIDELSCDWGVPCPYKASPNH